MDCDLNYKIREKKKTKKKERKKEKGKRQKLKLQNVGTYCKWNFKTWNVKCEMCNDYLSWYLIGLVWVVYAGCTIWIVCKFVILAYVQSELLSTIVKEWTDILQMQRLLWQIGLVPVILVPDHISKTCKLPTVLRIFSKFACMFYEVSVSQLD